MEQLTQLLVNSIKPKLSKLISFYDFNRSLPTELKELPSKFNELTRHVKYLKKHVHDLEIKLPGDLKEIPTKLETFTSTAKIKILDALPSLLNKVTEALNKFAHVIEFASKKLFQRKDAKDAKKANLNKSIPTTTPVTSTISPIITTTTTQLQSPFLLSSPKSSSQLEGELIKKDKGKEAMSLKDAEEEGVETDAAKQEVEARKEECIDLLGVDVVTKYYKAKLQYDKYCDKMLNKRAHSRITNCDVLTKKGLITLKVYREDGTDEERMDYLHKTKAKLRIDLDKPLGEEDPLNKLNDLARKKRKHADDIHDLFRSTKKFKSSVQYGDYLARIVLNEPILEIFFRLYQGPGLDDHARTFSSLLLAEVDKRNLNPLKQMRTIEQLRQQML
ncbi:hypothetical protein Tco_1053003 [Tanacetum coccineum]